MATRRNEQPSTQPGHRAGVRTRGRHGAPWIAALVLLPALLLAGCDGQGGGDTPQAAFERWQQAAEDRDVEAYFEAVVEPNGVEFLMNVIVSWRDGEWGPAGDPRHDAIGAVLRAHGLDALDYPLGYDDRARLDSVGSLPAVMAELFDAIDGQGPRGVAMWDLLTQPVRLGEVGPVDTFSSAPATATIVVFDVTTMRPRERTDEIRFFRDEAGTWRAAPPSQ